MLLPRSDFYTLTMVSLGAAVPVLAPPHTSIVSRSQIVHCPAYFFLCVRYMSSAPVWSYTAST